MKKLAIFILGMFLAIATFAQSKENNFKFDLGLADKNIQNYEIIYNKLQDLGITVLPTKNELFFAKECSEIKVKFFNYAMEECLISSGIQFTEESYYYNDLTGLYNRYCPIYFCLTFNV